VDIGGDIGDLDVGCCSAGLIYAERGKADGGELALGGSGCIAVVPLVSLDQSDTWVGSAKAAEDDRDLFRGCIQIRNGKPGWFLHPDQFLGQRA